MGFCLFIFCVRCNFWCRELGKILKIDKVLKAGKQSSIIKIIKNADRSVNEDLQYDEKENPYKGAEMRKCYKIIRNRIEILLLAGILSGCGNSDKKEIQTETAATTTEAETTTEIKTTKEETSAETESEKPTLDSSLTSDLEQDTKKELSYSSEDGKTVFSFADLKNLEFSLASGAGGWETTLVIHADGSFSGNYYDRELGVSGDDYPNGTVYCCDFTGQFTKPLKESSFFYTMKVSKINCLQKTGTEEIEDGIRYVYTNPYGLEKEDQVRIYMPEAPTILLPESFDNWMGEYAVSNYPEGLPFYALNNITLQVGFVSYDLVENLREQIDAVETEALAIEDSLAEGLPTQIDYNEKTGELYQVWDDALNTVWKTLKKVKTETEMKPITAEERKWINYKEQEIDKAGKEYEGGMAQMMIMHEKGAELTKARVYELLELFD